MKQVFAQARGVFLALFVIAVGQAIMPVSLERWMWLHRPALLAWTVGSTMLGVFLLVGAAVVRMVREEQTSFSDRAAFAEFGQAWRSRLWRSDARWRGLFAMAAGAALLFAGIMGTVLVLGTNGIKFMILLVLLYVVVQFLRSGR